MKIIVILVVLVGVLYAVRGNLGFGGDSEYYPGIKVDRAPTYSAGHIHKTPEGLANLDPSKMSASQRRNTQSDLRRELARIDGLIADGYGSSGLQVRRRIVKAMINKF